MAQVNPPSIMAAMECPVCYELLRPPIRVCRNEHAVCGDCHRKIERSPAPRPSCPLCRCDFQRAPSRILEVVYDNLRVPCRNSGDGCPTVDYGCAMKVHERTCNFRARSCPKKDQGCDWEGPLTTLTRHYLDNHA